MAWIEIIAPAEQRLHVSQLEYSGYETVVYRGSRTYSKTRVLCSKRSDDNFSDEDCSQLHNQLPASFYQEEQRRLVTNLTQWIHEQHRPEVFHPQKILQTLWMSKNLSLHLNMAISTPRPSTITQQAFFIGQGLPALLITVYDRERDGDYEAARSYALELVQHHSRVMQNYCYHEFVVLPITIEQTELSPKIIQEKIKEEVKQASVYYKEPVYLTEEAYISLRKGMAAVSAGTMMPYLLHHRPTEPKWTLQLDGQWRQLLHTFLDHMADGGDRDWLQQPPEVFPKTLIAFLEAVKRLSYTEQVTVCTSDPSIRDCLERSQKHSQKEHGILECWDFSGQPTENGVIVTLAEDTVTYQRKKYTQTGTVMSKMPHSSGCPPATTQSRKDDATPSPVGDSLRGSVDTADVFAGKEKNAEFNLEDCVNSFKLDTKNNGGRVTSLITASCNGDAYAVTNLLSRGVDVNSKDSSGITSLHKAVRQGHINVVELLIAKGADISARDRDGVTALHLAARHGHTDIADILIKNGAEVNANGGARLLTPLHEASFFSHTDVARYLIKHGAKVNAHADRKKTPLHFACEKNNTEIVQLLMDNGAEITARDAVNRTSLHLAAQQNCINTCEFLITKGVDLNMTDTKGATALLLASDQGHTEVVSLLLKHGADSTKRAKSGFTALQLASQQGHVEVVNTLLKHSAHISEESRQGFSALCLASLMGHVEVVNCLLEHSAIAITTTDTQGFTALHWASFYGRVEVVNPLLKHGADINTTNTQGATALYLASQDGHVAVVNTLLEHGADINITDTQGFTALHCASRNSQEEVVDILLKHGADT